MYLTSGNRSRIALTARTVPVLRTERLDRLRVHDDNALRPSRPTPTTRQTKVRRGGEHGRYQADGHVLSTARAGVVIIAVDLQIVNSACSFAQMKVRSKKFGCINTWDNAMST